MLKAVSCLAVFGCLLLAPSMVRAQLPTGVWKINATGYKGELVITSIKDGKVEGTLFGDAITGSYEENTKCLTFLRLQQDANQGYKGYLFSETAGNQVHYRLAGVFRAYYVSGDGRNQYGWYAKTTREEKQEKQDQEPNIVTGGERRETATE